MSQPDGVTGDEVERALLQARALVDTAMSNHRRSTGRALVELAPDDASVGAAFRQLVAAARHDVECVRPSGRQAAQKLGAVLPELGRLAAAGTRVRLLCPLQTAGTLEGLRFLDRAGGLGLVTRLAELPPHELVLVDERVALVRSNVGTAGQQALVAHAPAIVRSLSALFAGAWESARPVTGRRSGEWTPDSVTRQILGFLSAGYKDDAAARRLDLSVRTYRRYVAEIMRDMGAASRFQAGVRAAELGLLPRAS
jgi:hypothetical protein